MPTAEIGRWEFYVPEGWGFKDSSIGISYLESADGSMGMYVKEVEMSNPMATSQALSEQIQAVHRNGFEQDPVADWEAVDSRGRLEGQFYRSALDLYDSHAAYRVLSLVACNEQRAVQITVHDYNCVSYVETKDQFENIESSIRQFAGMA